MSDQWDKKSQEAAAARYEAEWREMVDKAGTPESSALDIMDDLEDLWLAVAPGKTEDDFDEEIAEPYHDRCDIDVEAMKGEYLQLNGFDALEFARWPLIEQPILIAYGHAVLARLAHAVPGDPAARDYAWSNVREAASWHGVAMGLAKIWNGGRGPVSISEVNRKGGLARNAENHAIRDDAFQWLDDNFSACKSKDDAAEQLTRIVPAAFRTCRRYIDKWDLSRRAARGE
ncbi:hypothetical protein AB4Y43_18700 [Paraburkholderia sp. BR10872]|uniref:hypothetical protein n=1 Tax=Paraburkholderia sp. BR10872 TaxID=3236989 RepID=UPI0034D219D0